MDALPILASNLKAGPFGVAALATIAASVCIPATQYKNLYGISVGYGLSVAAIAAALRHVFPIVPHSVGDFLTGSALFYGLRLAIYLFIRDVTRAKPLTSTNEPTRIKRIPFALSLALFYAFMTAPLLYALRSPVGTSFGSMTWQIRTAWMGTGLAWAGATLETIADAQKFVVKSHAQGSAFRGPSTGAYSITRHPNYTGEVMFWLGLFVAGIPSFQTSLIAWLTSTAGLFGIVSIMRGATKSLEKRQAEKYGGQPKYEAWKKSVSSPLVPFVRG